MATSISPAQLKTQGFRLYAYSFDDIVVENTNIVAVTSEVAAWVL